MMKNSKANHETFSNFDRFALRDLIRRVKKPCVKMLEVGSWIGDGSTKVFMEELKNVEGAKLYCVDTWQGTEGTEHQKEISKDNTALPFGLFWETVCTYQGKPFVYPLVMSSEEAVSFVFPEEFDLIFLDGNHAYSEIKEDIKRWIHRVKKDGILCGHDCEGSLNKSYKLILQRETLWDDREMDTINWCHTIHPGVVLAVDEIFGEKVHLWANGPPIIDLEEGKKGFSSIWDIKI